MADQIEAEFGIKAELVGGAVGAFNVDADGRRLFSKSEVGRFPEDEEILIQLRDR